MENYTSIERLLILDRNRIRTQLSDKFTDIDRELLNMACDDIDDRNNDISDEEEEFFEPDEASPCAQFVTTTCSHSNDKAELKPSQCIIVSRR